MSGPGRRALLGSALTLRAATAEAQPSAAFRLSFPSRWAPSLMPALAEFSKQYPHLRVDIGTEAQDVDWVSTALQDDLQTERPDVALVGAAALALGKTRGLWRVLPAGLREANHASMGGLAAQMRPLTGEEAIVVSADPGGPFLLHRRSVLSEPPRGAATLLDYARQNPQRFLYPRPSAAAFGQQFVMALPYLLGDRNPSDAQSGWEQSWRWMREVDPYVAYYASGSGEAMQEFSEGGIDLLPVSLGAFLQGRMSGRLPEDARLASFDIAPAIPRGLFLVVPNHVPPERMVHIEALASFLLRPEMQTLAFGRGLLPAGPEFGIDGPAPRTDAEKAAWDRALPMATAAMAARRRLSPLPADQLAFVLGRWDEEIGATHNDGR
nr:extracellular solute-binding protein [uncultured Roseococcus sp.]